VSEAQFLNNRFVREGKTKFAPFDGSSLIPIGIILWKEVWTKGDLQGRIRSLYVEIKYGDDHVVVGEQTTNDLLRRTGQVLLMLTERR